MRAQVVRWGMFAFSCVVVVGMIGTGLYLCFSDPWIGEHMLPMAILMSLPTAGMGFFWFGRAKGYW
jgi:hypothetical protein